MKRSLVFGTVLALSLAVIVAVATLIPAFAHDKKSDSTFTLYTTGGQVTLELPEGKPGHVGVPWKNTTMRIFVDDAEARSYGGAADLMLLSIWSPTYNRLIPFVYISDNDNADFIALLKAAWAKFPIAYGGLITVADEELEVWRRGDIVTANLTKAVNVNFTFPYSAYNFTLPAMVMEFRGIDDAYKEPEDTTDLYSGYNVTFTSIDKPAWVRVWIPAWLGGQQWEFVGIVNLHETMTYTGPPPPP